MTQEAAHNGLVCALCYREVPDGTQTRHMDEHRAGPAMLAALEDIEAYACRYWYEGDKAYQFAIIARATIAQARGEKVQG